jgi:hypothetical protein
MGGLRTQTAGLHEWSCHVWPRHLWCLVFVIGATTHRLQWAWFACVSTFPKCMSAQLRCHGRAP